MFLLRLKVFIFLSAYAVFSACFTMAIALDATETKTKDKIEKTSTKTNTADNLDFEVILAGIKHYDELVKSGEGKVVVTFKQPRFPTNDPDHSIVFTGDITFASDKIRLNSLGKTYVSKPTGMWEIVRYRKRKPNYYFSLEPGLSALEALADPREWLIFSNDVDFSTYLRRRNFRIQRSDTFKGIPCYVLEAKIIQTSISSSQPGDRIERFWISPARGFRYLKYERQQPLKVDILSSDIKKGTPSIHRRTLSYQQFGDAWFPEAGVIVLLWIDSTGREHVISQKTLETRDFKVNHAIPSETFTVNIPDDAMIGVNRRKLSKAEFLKQYGQK